MYKKVIILGLVLTFAQALPQSDVREVKAVKNIDIDIDIDLSSLVELLTALVNAIRNIDLSGILDLGIDIDIGIDLNALANFLETILIQYHAGNKTNLLCLVQVAEEHDITEAANFYINHLLSYIDLINTIAVEVRTCKLGGILPNPIAVIICLNNVAANNGLRIAVTAVNLTARWAEISIVAPSILRCIAEIP